MSSAQKRTIRLPADQSDYVDALIASGTYGTASDVVRAGLQALQERDAEIQHWLIEAVAPAYDALHATPDRSIDLDTAFSDLRRRKGHG
ncbi:MAG: type II toxin-antitoxin system ParD family antitoxin [Asticcacaulis sp.]